jgi:hypothetical protein
VRVNVPVKFTNHGLSPGLKRGGVLNIVRHEIEVICPAGAGAAFLSAASPVTGSVLGCAPDVMLLIGLRQMIAEAK